MSLLLSKYLNECFSRSRRFGVIALSKATLHRHAASCPSAMTPIRWHLQSWSEGKRRGAEISLISRLVRCISLWALLIMSNQSEVLTWKKPILLGWVPFWSLSNGGGLHLEEAVGWPSSATPSPYSPLRWILIPFFFFWIGLLVILNYVGRSIMSLYCILQPH